MSPTLNPSRTITASIHAGISVAPVNIAGDISELQALQLWVDNKKSAHTRRAYARAMKEILHAIGKPIRSITLLDLSEWRKSLEAPSSENPEGRGWRESKKALAVNTLKSFYKFAHEIGFLGVNPARTLKSPKLNPAVHERILPEEDVWRMISGAESERDRAILALLYASKVRVSELVRIRWKDLVPATDKGRENGVGGSVYVIGKGEKPRTIGIPQKTWNRVQSLKKSEASDLSHVFSAKNGKSLTTASIWLIVKKTARRAGINGRVSPHWFRHCGASHAVNRGAPLKLVQDELGHSNLNTTAFYLHSKKDEASSVLLSGV